MKRVKLILFAVISLMVLNLLASRGALVLEDKNYTSKNLLRLHVVANSNSLLDQSIKRRVRNKIIASTRDLFKNVKNITEASDIVKNNERYLINIAKEEINKLEKDYKIKIKVGETYFPKRTYGSVTLKKGSYQAVNIIIGEGKGENWWCVLFPPLCFVDSIDSIEKNINQTEKGNSVKEISLGNAEKIDVQFKFKLLEYVKENPEIIKKNFQLAKIFSFYN